MTILVSVKGQAKFASTVLVSWSSKLGVSVAPPQAPPPSGDYVSSVIVGSSCESEYSVPYPGEVNMRSSVLLASLSAGSARTATLFVSAVEAASAPVAQVLIEVGQRSLVSLGSSHVISYAVKELPEEVIIFPKTVDVDNYVHYPYFPVLSVPKPGGYSHPSPLRLVQGVPVPYLSMAEASVYAPGEVEVVVVVDAPGLQLVRRLLGHAVDSTI